MNFLISILVSLLLVGCGNNSNTVPSIKSDGKIEKAKQTLAGLDTPEFENSQVELGEDQLQFSFSHTNNSGQDLTYKFQLLDGEREIDSLTFVIESFAHIDSDTIQQLKDKFGIKVIEQNGDSILFSKNPEMNESFAKSIKITISLDGFVYYTQQIERSCQLAFDNHTPVDSSQNVVVASGPTEMDDGALEQSVYPEGRYYDWSKTQSSGTELEFRIMSAVVNGQSIDLDAIEGLETFDDEYNYKEITGILGSIYSEVLELDTMFHWINSSQNADEDSDTNVLLSDLGIQSNKLGMVVSSYIPESKQISQFIAVRTDANGEGLKFSQPIEAVNCR